MEVPDKFIAVLKEEMENADFCFLCRNHLSHGHAKDCPLWEETP